MSRTPVRDPTAPYYGGAAPSGARLRSSGDGRTCPTWRRRKPARERRDRTTRGAAGSAEGFGTEKPRRAPGVWHPKIKLSRPWRPAPPLFDIAKTFARDRPGDLARPSPGRERGDSREAPSGVRDRPNPAEPAELPWRRAPRHRS